VTLEAVILADGSRAYNLIGPEGEVLAKGLNEDVALSEQFKANENLASEQLLAEAQAAASEEGQAATAEAEAATRLLPAEARTSAAVVLDFVPNEQPTPEQSAAVGRLETALAKDPRSAGRGIKLSIQTPLDPTTGSGRAALDFVQGWERATGKQIIFVASEDVEPLPFTGVVSAADPNTIFLDAAGDRSLVAVVGHEWAHTLARTNPQLHGAMVEAMRPYVIDWMQQEGLLKEGGYTEGNVTEELVSNIVGDAIAHPEFWRQFQARNPSLFERVVQAIKEWFASLAQHARESEWGTEGFISNLEAIHSVVMSAIESARQAGPELVPAAATEAKLSFVRARDESYRAKDQQWWKDFAAWRDGRLKKEHVFNFGPASDELLLAGFPEGNITLTQRVLQEKSTDPKHPFPVESLANLPKKLRDPIAVFKSRSMGDALTVLTEVRHKGENFVVAVHFRPTETGQAEITSIHSIYPKNTGAILGWIRDGLATYYHKEKAREWLSPRIAGTNIQRAGVQSELTQSWNQLQATANVKTNEDIVNGTQGPPGGLSFAGRRGKAAQARAEGISREESVAAAFERMHAVPAERLALLERIKGEYQRVRAQNVAAEAGVVAPAPVNPTAEIDRLEATETKTLEDLDIAEQDALDRSSQEIADRYGERILAEQDPVARRALERESKNVAAAQRKGIEKQFDERRKAIESDFRRQQQAVRVAAEQATLAATKEGAAQLVEMRRIHAFAELNALVKALPPEVRGHIGGPLTLAQIRATETSLTDFLTKRIAMIDRILEQTLRAEYLSRVHNLLELTRPKRAENRILKSNLGAEAQAVADIAYSAAELDNDETAGRLAEIEDALGQPDLSPEKQVALAEEYAITNLFGDLNNRTAENLASAYQWLNDAAKAGKTKWRIQEEARLGQTRGRGDELVTSLGRATASGLARKEQENLVQAIVTGTNSFALSHFSLIQILEHLFPDVSFIRELQDKARLADNGGEDFAREVGKRFTAALQKVIGSESKYALAKAAGFLQEIHKDRVQIFEGRQSAKEKISISLAQKIAAGEVDLTQPVDTTPTEGEFKITGPKEPLRLKSEDVAAIREALNALPVDSRKKFITFEHVVSKGTKQSLPMSRSDAIQYLISWEQPDVQEKMRRQGWTDESAQQMADLIRDPVSLGMMNYLRGDYRSDASYNQANEIYRRMFGMNMPRGINYGPTRYRQNRDTPDIGPYGGPVSTAGVLPGFAKSRVEHNAMMRQMGAEMVYQQHTAQQAHFIHFAELNRELRGIFGRQDVREAIEQKYGRAIQQLMDRWVDALSGAGDTRAAELMVDSAILKMAISGRSVASLGFNPRSTMAQLDSGFRMIFAMPMHRIAKAFLDPLAFLSNIPKAWASDTVQRRIQDGGSPEAKYVFKRLQFSPHFLLNELARVSLLPLNYFDAALTSFSSAVVYTDSYNQAKAAGLNDVQAEAQALDDMDSAVYRYSQPTGTASKSLREISGNTAQKLFMFFMSDPRLKSSLYIQAAQDLELGRNRGAAIRRIVASHLMVGLSQTMVNLARDWFSDDDDEEIWTWESYVLSQLLAPFGGFVWIGAGVNYALSRLLKQPAFAGRSENPIFALFETGDAAARHIEDALNFDDPDAMIKEWNNIAKTAALTPAFAAPAVLINAAKNIRGAYKNIQKEED
jgi:hypothetical protein